MGTRVKALIPVVGMLLVFGFTVVAVTRQAREMKQPLPQSIGDLATAKLIEVKEAGGRTVLSGTLTFVNEQDGDVEGKANLTAATAGASGKAEVEVSTQKNGAKRQELEVEARGLAAGASYTLHVDGQQAATFSADGRGGAELELSSE